MKADLTDKNGHILSLEKGSIAHTQGLSPPKINSIPTVPSI